MQIRGQTVRYDIGSCTGVVREGIMRTNPLP